MCLALRPAGRAFSSGFAWVSGWPGGARGRRIELMIDAFLFRRLDCEDFIALGQGDDERMLSPQRRTVKQFGDVVRRLSLVRLLLA